MDQKRASDEGAFLRQIVQLTGRDILVFRAMQEPNQKLWFREGFGFSDQAPPQPDGWLKIDDASEQPATMSADELVQTHLARGKASNERELLSVLGLPANMPVCRIDLAEPKISKVMKPIYESFRKWIEWRDKALQDFKQRLAARTTTQMHSAILDVEALIGGDGWSDAEQQKLNSAIARCKFIEKMPDDLVRALEGEPILECWKAAYQLASGEVDLAKTAAKPRSAGGRKTVDLDGARSHLVRAHDALMFVINGCPGGN
jgi:hypothetical protein